LQLQQVVVIVEHYAPPTNETSELTECAPRPGTNH
jgi:hypothetical protein